MTMYGTDSVSGRESHYLPHLDGIRCIALLGVLCFHFDVPHVDSGYLGVDVFLTLSGYLITRNILRDIERNRFSLKAFYIRRFFRLYPSACFTSLISVLLAFLTFPTGLAYETAVSALCSMSFASNIYFHKKDNYFSSSADLKPLLHTWSLSLEEQFYILWPVLFSFLPLKELRKARVLVCLYALTFGSFFIAVQAQKRHPSFSFFELPARVFQFSLGSILAWTQKQELTGRVPRIPRTSSSHSFLEAAHAFSLFGIFYLFTLPQTGSTVFTSLVASLSTIAQIYCEETKISKTILKSTLLGTLGKISYSAYLLHWPLFVFSNHVRLALHKEQPSAVLLCLTTFPLALLMYHFVENALRNSEVRRNRTIVLVVVSSSFAISTAGIITQGFAFRYPTNSPFLKNTMERRNAELNDLTEKLKTFCNLEQCSEISQPAHDTFVCCVGDINGERAPYTIFGDSFARHDAPAFHVIGKQRRVWFPIYSQAGCPVKSLPDIKDGQEAFGCDKKRIELQRIMRNIPRNGSIIVVNNWDFSSRQEMLNTLTTMQVEIGSHSSKLIVVGEPPGLHSREKALFHALDLASLPFGKMLHVSDHIELNRKAAQCSDSQSSSCVNEKRRLRPLSHRLKQYRWYRDIFQNKLKNIMFIDRFRPLCSENNGTLSDTYCSAPVRRDDPPLDVGYMRDRLHLDWSGGKWFANLFDRALYNSNSTALTLSPRTMDGLNINFILR